MSALRSAANSSGVLAPIEALTVEPVLDVLQQQYLHGFGVPRVDEFLRGAVCRTSRYVRKVGADRLSYERENQKSRAGCGQETAGCLEKFK